jgi:uncharacterized protein YbaR (Trm112 family)
VDETLLRILVCPVTKGPLIYVKEKKELVSLDAKLAYAVKDDIPVMLADEARPISEQELEKLKG